MQKAIIQPLQQPVEKIIELAGSKSITNRALLIASLARGRSVLKNYSTSDDSKTIIEFLKKLGARITMSGNNLTIYDIVNELPTKKKIEHNVGPAGTAARFLTAYGSAFCPNLILDGSERMRQRPMKPLFQALENLGAKFKFLQKPYSLPFKVIKTLDFTRQEVEVLGSISSQFITALLIISPFFKQLNIKVKDKLVSEPYADITLAVMESFSVKVEKQTVFDPSITCNTGCNCQSYSCSSNFKKELEEIMKNEVTKIFKINSSRYTAKNYFIEADASSSSYLWSIAAITKSKIGVKNLPIDSIQSDSRYADLLAQMGCKVNKKSKDNIIEVIGTEILKPLTIDMEAMPDTAQTLAVTACFTKGRTEITGLSTLKHKESDRLTATETELKKMQVDVFTGEDFIIIESDANPKSAEINTYDDHRMAMAFAVAGARIPMTINNPEVVAKSFPEFWQILTEIGVKVDFTK